MVSVICRGHSQSWYQLSYGHVTDNGYDSFLNPMHFISDAAMHVGPNDIIFIFLFVQAQTYSNLSVLKLFLP